MHPRLIHTLVLLDPVIQRQTTQLDPLEIAQCRVCIVCSKDLSLDAAHQVCDISVDLPSSQVP